MQPSYWYSSQFGYWLGAGLLAVALGGCATTPPPLEDMNRAESAIQEAEQSGAREYAPLELKFAREKFAAAEAAIREEEYERAERLAEEALVNAQLAEAKADSAKARESAQRVRESVETLRRELLRREGDQ